ncbi:MAG: BamA/TamA family outer membrane protein [Bacteroidales bacterium]|nr:BamA/TamA family outer membrane protein [Bacteroidales bacterium]
MIRAVKGSILKYPAILLASVLILAQSCSTTRVIGDRNYRLQSNHINILNGDRKNPVSVSDLSPYIKQKVTVAWTPGYSIYNWQNGKGGKWDKFVSKLGKAPVIYDPSMVDRSCESIASHLEWMGYYGSKVEPRIDIHKKKVRVYYDVTLGKQFTISEFNITYPDGVFGREMSRCLGDITIHEGDRLSTTNLENEMNRLTLQLRDNGIYNFNTSNIYFTADTLGMDGKSAKLSMDIREYPRGSTPADAREFRVYTMDSVSISLPLSMKFRDKRLSSFNLLKSGNTYSQSEISKTYNRLSGIRAFSSVNISTAETSDSTVSCNIRLSKSKPKGVEVGLEASLNSELLFGISPNLSFYNKNFFHGGEVFRASFMGNFQFKKTGPKEYIHSNEAGMALSLSLPTFLLLPDRIFTGNNIPRTDFNLSYNYQGRPEYTRHIISASCGYSGYLGHKQNIYYKFYPLQVNIVRISGADPKFIKSLESNPFLANAYHDHLDIGIQTVWTYSSARGPLASNTDHFYTRLSFDASGALISLFNNTMKTDANGMKCIWDTPYSQYLRGELTLGKTWTFGRTTNQAIATRLLGGIGYAYGNSKELPFEKHFYAGGAYSLRGWQARTVGPGSVPLNDSFVIANQTGDIKLEANIEYRIHMVWKLDGAVFVDAGNVWTMNETGTGGTSSLLNSKTFLRSIAADWGIGLRVDMNFLVLRLDWGMRLHNPVPVDGPSGWVNPAMWVKKDGYAIHFAIGYPF